MDRYQNQGFIPQNEVPVHKYRTLLVHAIHPYFFQLTTLEAFCCSLWKVRWWLGLYIPGSSGVWCLQKRVSCTRRGKLNFTKLRLQSCSPTTRFQNVTQGLYFCVQTTHDNTTLANSTAKALRSWSKVMTENCP